MKQIVQNYKTGELKLEEAPIPSIKAGGILVKNQCSLVSIGTERSMTELAQKNIIGKAKQRPDLVKQVITKAKKDGIINTINTVKNKLDVVKPLGYSSSGIVIGVGEGADEEFELSDRVACAGAGYASHADIIFVPKNLCAKIPENVSFEDAACSTIGAVALQGVRVTNPLLGEKMAVIGLGLVGQITAQILRSTGCTVLGFDVNPDMVATALKLGLECGISDLSDVESAVKSISKGYGMDGVIITASTQSNSPVEMAAEIARDNGRVVVVGNVGMNIPRDIFYKKELELRLSRSYGPGRYDTVYEEKGIDYPYSYVRWTEKRNIETVLELLSQKKLQVSPLITHSFPIESAETIYELLNGKVDIHNSIIAKHRLPLKIENKNDKSIEKDDKLLGILIKYKDEHSFESTLQIPKSKLSTPSDSTHNQIAINVGLIGAGNFVKSTLLPILKNLSNIRLKGLATSTGINAKINAEKHDFEYCTTNYHEILNDNEIDIVIIATRHDLHWKLAVEALKNEKDIFVEKPLATCEEDLNKIIDSWKHKKQRLMVGFNRRFSPFSIKIKEFFNNRKEPLTLNYRINAGFISKNNWVNDPNEGGGRIIGEVCHFVDLLHFFVNVEPVKVYAELMSNSNNYVNDNININMKFKDGSIGSITYVSCGDKSFSKERLEIFGNGSVAVIDDFKSGILVRNGKTRKIKGAFNDKGHKKELEEFVSSVSNGKESPISFKESVLATRITFKIIESIRTGKPIIL